MPSLRQELERFQEEVRGYAADFFSAKLSADISPRMAALIQEAESFVLAGGKRLRPFLFWVGYEAAGGSRPGEARRTSLFLELLHQYLVCHDDIMDRDLMRRGRPTLHAALRTFDSEGIDEHRGLSLGILAGDLLCTYAYEIVLESPFSAEAVTAVGRRLNRMLGEVVEGQALDILLTNTVGEVGEDEVLRIARLKTAAYTLEGPLHLGALLAGGSTGLLDELSLYGRSLGISFQLRDDILGVFGKTSQTGKSTLSDLQEGKSTLLIWHLRARATPEELSYLDRWLGNPELGEEQGRQIRELMRRYGSLEYVQAQEEALLLESQDALRSAVTIPAHIKSLLSEFSVLITRRES